MMMSVKLLINFLIPESFWTLMLHASLSYYKLIKRRRPRPWPWQHQHKDDIVGMTQT
jgi:hypothetical protein